MMGEQAQQIGRVFATVAPLILDFMETRREHKGSFHADDLREYVRGIVPSVAPASPDRILRDMRQKGLLNYVVTNRRASAYQFVY